MIPKQVLTFYANRSWLTRSCFKPGTHLHNLLRLFCISKSFHHRSNCITGIGKSYPGSIIEIFSVVIPLPFHDITGLYNLHYFDCLRATSHIAICEVARNGGDWECCQCGSVASSNVANFQLGIGNAKLPNGMLPNYRMECCQTTERLLRGIGYFDIMFAIWQKNYRKPRHAAYVFLTEDRRRRTEDLGHWTLDGCGIAEFMVTYRRFQKREK